MIRRYQHVSITVGDLDRSIAFYRDVVGFQVADRMSASGEELSRALDIEDVSLKLATLTSGELILELIEYLSPERNQRAPRACDVGSMHMALDVDDIHVTYKEWSAKGVRFNTPPQRNPPGIAWAWWCYLKDPDGVPIELVQVKP